MDDSGTKEAIRCAASDPETARIRIDLAEFAAATFHEVGHELHVVGHILGDDRKNGSSPFGHGDDAVVAVSMLLRIGGQLLSGSATLIGDGRHYAGAALVRQLVEVEYLAWAFDAKNEEAARWLRSTREERQGFFTPAKLRKAAEGRFRGVDYSYHCELGGHPVPGSWTLLNGDDCVAQLMLSDCLGHAGRVWDHVIDWAQANGIRGTIAQRAPEMLRRFTHWKTVDSLTALPPPPDYFPA